MNEASTKGSVKKLTLPSGVVVEMTAPKLKHTTKAMRMVNNENDRMVFALIAICCTFDGQPRVVEDIEEMEMMGDGSAIMEAFGELMGPTLDHQKGSS